MNLPTKLLCLLMITSCGTLEHLNFGNIKYFVSKNWVTDLSFINISNKIRGICAFGKKHRHRMLARFGFFGYFFFSFNCD